MGFFFDARGLISSAIFWGGVFPVFFGVFVLLGGCFCALWFFGFVISALARFIFFGGGIGKAGNSRSEHDGGSHE